MPAVTLATLTSSHTPVTTGHTDNPLPPLLHTPHGLAIIEIQGTLNTPSSTLDFSIGRLHFPDPASNPNKVYFYVGSNQRLAGEVKKLAKPLAVIAPKRDAAPNDPSSDDNDNDLQIIDIVRHKLFFAGRPEFV